MSTRSTPLVARLGEVSFPIRTMKASGDPKTTSFDSAGPHGGRLLDHVVRAGVAGTAGVAADVEVREAGYTGTAVESKDVRRGVFLADDRFVDLTAHLDAIDDEEDLDGMEILAFVRREEIPLDRVLGSYWIAPGDADAARVLKLLHEVCRTRHRAAVVVWTKSKNRAEGLVVAHRSGALLLIEVAFPENAREIPPEALGPKYVEVTDEQLSAADALVESMSESAEVLDEVEDDRHRRRAELREFVETHGRAPELPAEQKIEPVSDEAATFLAALHS